LKASHRQDRSRRPRQIKAQPDQRRLESENERLLREIESLRRQLAEAEKRIAEGEKQIADLERQLRLQRRNSTTSSKPPSSDGLAGEQRTRGRKEKSRRKPGGQPGHRGRWRDLVPAERVNEVVEVFPPRCRHCSHQFADCGPKPSTDGEPRRHQVLVVTIARSLSLRAVVATKTELPRVEAHITEYQCQRALCPECGKATQAALPDEVSGHFGPRLTALIAYLTVVCRMPRRVVLELIGQVLGIQLSLGSVQSSWEEASEAVAEPCAELERELPNQPVVNSDETGSTNGNEDGRPYPDKTDRASSPVVNEWRETLALGFGRARLRLL
jgi:transposase